MVRSVLAIVAGYLVMAIAITVLFAVSFPDPVVNPSNAFMLFSLAYGFLFATLGGYTTAWIARRAEMSHATALAAFAAILGIISMIATTDSEPLWFELASLIVVVVAVLLGGSMRARQVAELAQVPNVEQDSTSQDG
jgi:peptidoglycan/LPS O-acetylase OafA/YrhL